MGKPLHGVERGSCCIDFVECPSVCLQEGAGDNDIRTLKGNLVASSCTPSTSGFWLIKLARGSPLAHSGWTRVFQCIGVWLIMLPTGITSVYDSV